MTPSCSPTRSPIPPTRSTIASGARPVAVRRGPQPRPARRRRAHRRAAARRRRRRVGQDPGAHPPDRPPDPRGRPPVEDPGDHVHQQGRRRDARARRDAGRAGRADDVGVDVPLGVRPHPAAPTPTRSATRGSSRSTTRPTRTASPATSSATSASTRSGSRRAACTASSASGRTSSSTRAGRRPGGEHLRPQARRRLRRVPGPAAQGRGDGLRRPAAQHGQAVPRARRRARALPPALRAHPRRRVPGHQPGPERDRAAARRRPPERLRRWRHRSVGVQVPGRRLPQHPRSSRRRSPTSRRSCSTRTTGARRRSSTPRTR